MTPPRKTPPPAVNPERSASPYAAITWRGTDTSTIRRHYFADPVEVLATAVEYLKSGYQVRLNDRTVAHFAEIGRAAGGERTRPRLVEGGAS